MARNYGVTYIVPPSAKKGHGFDEQELKETYKIARVRILVERWIGRLKTWNILAAQ